MRETFEEIEIVDGLNCAIRKYMFILKEDERSQEIGLENPSFKISLQSQLAFEDVILAMKKYLFKVFEPSVLFMKYGEIKVSHHCDNACSVRFTEGGVLVGSYIFNIEDKNCPTMYKIVEIPEKFGRFKEGIVV